MLAEHDHVFAGQVERTTSGGAAAEVRVLDVWHGPDLPPQVVVVGGQLDGGASSSTDRSYRTGQRYAFFVTRAEDGSLRDSACTPTAPLISGSALDPPGRRAPDPSADAPTDPRSAVTRWASETAAGVGVLGAAVAVAAVVRRRRRLGASS